MLAVFVGNDISQCMDHIIGLDFVSTSFLMTQKQLLQLSELLQYSIVGGTSIKNVARRRHEMLQFSLLTGVLYT